MSRWPRWLMFRAILAMTLALAWREASAQPRLGFGAWDGALEFAFEWERQQIKGEGSSDTKSVRTRYDERLTVRNTGAFILDPRLWTTSFGGTLGLFQEQHRFNHTESSLSGTLLGYSFDTAILAEKPYSATIFTNRNQNILSRDFGGRTELTFENRGGTFRLREDSILQGVGVRHFTSILGARQELTKESTTVLGETFRRDETRTVLNYEGSKGFETSDVTLQYEFTDLTDKDNPFVNFQSHTVGLNYSLDFGETRNRRWDSRLRYFARSGVARDTVLSVDEGLRIDHYENLLTDYRYLFSRVETGTGVTTTQAGTVKGQHRLYRNLTTALTGLGTLQDLPNGTRTMYAGQLDLDYQRAIPWGGRIFAATGVRYQVDDNRLEGSRVDVTDEPQTAPVPLGGNAGFLLANPFVINSTIAVVDTRGGARLPTTLGVDYLVIQEGNFTRIVPLATSPVVLAGDPFAVSYSFEVAPSLTFSTISWRGSLGVDFRWIGLSFTHDQSEQSLVSGRDSQFLENRTLDAARLDLRGDWEWVRGLAGAEYRMQEGNRLAFTSWRFDQLLSLRAPFSLVLSLSAHEAFTDFTLPRRRSTSASVRGDVTWALLPGLFINGFASLRTSEDSAIPSETIREAGVRVRWTLGRLEVIPSFTRIDRERGTTENTDLRFDLRVIRRF